MRRGQASTQALIAVEDEKRGEAQWPARGGAASLGLRLVDRGSIQVRGVPRWMIRRP